MKENWSQWIPIDNLSKKYYIQSIVDDVNNGFQLLLTDENNEAKNLLISFPHSVNAFRQTNETFTLLTIDYLNKTYSSDFYSQWTFFKIENSKYLGWIAEQSFNIGESPYYNFTHFCIITSDVILDIIATYEPTITIFK